MAFNILRRYTSKTSSVSDFVICGGGLVGSAVACAIAKHPSFKEMSVTLIDAAPQQTFIKSEYYSNRVSALSLFSKKMFERLGIWKHIQRCKEVNSMKVWGIYSDSYLELNDTEEKVVAYIVENGDLIQAISNEARSLPNIRQVYNKKISQVNIDKENTPSSLPSVVLADGSEYHCQVLIGADGINSVIRKAMNIDYLTWNYDQMAIVGTLNISECSNTIAWQRFLPDGPVALLPLNNSLSSLVWFTQKDKALHLLKLPNEDFVNAFNSALMAPTKSTSLGNVKKAMDVFFNSQRRDGATFGKPPLVEGVVDKSRAIFPIGFGHSVNYVSPHTVLIGDAAHRIHPLAGQGVNLGFRDINCLECALSNGIKNGRELGDFEDLKNYESMCQTNNVPIMAFIELIHRTYTSDHEIIQLFGDLSIHFANSYYPLKERINKKALFLRY